MFFHIQKLINPIAADEPDPAAANILQEGLGGQFGEMRTMMQYLFQSFNARGDAKPFKDLIQGVGIEGISHVELITTTINMLLDGSARSPEDAEGKIKAGRSAGQWRKHTARYRTDCPQSASFHRCTAMRAPCRWGGNPWSGSDVYASGNLVLDLFYNRC